MARKLNLRRKHLLGQTVVLILALTIVFVVPHSNRLIAQVTAMKSSHNIAGNWQGEFPDKTKVIFLISKNGEGWRAVIYFPDDFVYPTSIPVVALQGDQISFSSVNLNSKYSGKLSADGNSIDGVWTTENNAQGGTPRKPGPEALPMARATRDTAWAIPSNGLPPVMAPTLDPSFEVATVKPHNPNVPGGGWQWKGARHFYATMTVTQMIEYIYGIHAKQLINQPQWADKDVYDFEGVPNMPGLPTEQQRIGMMRKLLEERFNLKVHTEKRDLTALVLSLAKGGPKMTPSVLVDPGTTMSMRMGAAGGLMWTARNAAMGDLIRELQNMLDMSVLDQTGLTGQFDFDLNFSPDESVFGGNVHLPPSATPPPGLITAMQEQIGLKLDRFKGPVDVIVIDRLERPTPN